MDKPIDWLIMAAVAVVVVVLVFRVKFLKTTLTGLAA